MNDLLQRRAALESAGQTRSMASLAPGTELLIEENMEQIPYIYLGTDACGNAIVLRRYVLTPYHRMNATSEIGYPASEMDSWLQNTVLSRYHARVLESLCETTISFSDYSPDAPYTQVVSTASRKIFLPSYYEMGLGGNEGGTDYLNALKAYRNTDNSNTARIGEDAGGSAHSVWLRSAYSTSAYPNRYRLVMANGAGSWGMPTAVNYVRPMLSFHASTPVQKNANGFAV